MAVDVKTLTDKQELTKQAALAIAGNLYHYKWIAKAVGITDETLRHYRDSDPDFSLRLDQERAQFIAKNMKKARPEYLLSSADPETFGEKKVIELRNPIREMIARFDLDKVMEGEIVDDRKDDGDVQISSPENT